MYSYFKIYFYMSNFASIGRFDLVMKYFLTVTSDLLPPYPLNITQPDCGDVYTKSLF